MKIDPVDGELFLAAVESAKSNGNTLIVAPVDELYSPDDVDFFENAVDAAERLWMDPEKDCYSSYSVDTVLEALKMVLANDLVAKEFTTKEKKDLLDVGKLAWLLENKKHLKEILQYVDWSKTNSVEQLLKDFCDTNTGRAIANEVWNATVPKEIMKPPLLAPVIQPDSLKHLNGPGQKGKVNRPPKGIR